MLDLKSQLSWFWTRGRCSDARRAILLIISIASIIRGFAYGYYQGSGGPSFSGGAVENLATILTNEAIGLFWILFGVFGLHGVIMRRWRWATAANGGMHMLWGAGYLMSTLGIIDGRGSDWISASTYLSIGLIIWGTMFIVEARRPSAAEVAAITEGR